jgi:putative two-component system response regulator
VPPTTGAALRTDDFRRSIALIAGLAVGFFPPSLWMAGVPSEMWPLYLAAAAFAGITVAGSFFVVRPRTMGAFLAAFGAVSVVAAIGWLFQGYYHQIGLLFSLVVSAYAIVHGFRASMGAVIPGALYVPLLVHSRAGVNPTDPVYALIYLFGAALIPWTAGRLAMRRAGALRKQLAATRAAEREAVLILARAAEAKDEDTGEHVGRVGDLSAELARRMGLEPAFVADLRFAALLHDVGKLHVPDRVLLKPGRLDASEWEVMRRHTTWGELILGRSEAFELARVIARSHHEDWNGEGYPDSLRGVAIPLPARIVRLADVFDALRSERSYKPAWELQRCIEEIMRNAGRQFDPELVPLFVQLIEDAPLGPWVARTSASSESEHSLGPVEAHHEPAGGVAERGVGLVATGHTTKPTPAP